MISVETAWERIANTTKALSSRELPTAEAAGAVLAKDALAQTDLPPFDQSALDGVVIRTADYAKQRGVPQALTFRLGEEIAAGAQLAPPGIAVGEARRIYTGAMVPKDADSMVPREVVAIDGDSVRCSELPGHRANIRSRGEELREGATVLPAGTRLAPSHIAALSMAGIASVVAMPRVRVAVLTTGDEVVPPGGALRPGQVYDANAAFLRAFAAQNRLELVRMQHVADDPEELHKTISEAANDADLIITTGGVSVGEKDYVMACSARAGFEEIFWKVSQKPGKPLYYATRASADDEGDCVLIGLPGNPAAVVVNAYMFVLRIVDALQGARDLRPNFRMAAALREMGGRADRGVWVRCRRITRDEGEVLEPLGGQGSHMLSNFAECDAIAWVPAGESVAAGDFVRYVAI